MLNLLKHVFKSCGLRELSKVPCHIFKLYCVLFVLFVGVAVILSVFYMLSFPTIF